MNDSSSTPKQMESVGSILSRLMASSSMSNLAAYAPIWNDWPALVGDKLAQHISPLSVSNGRLRIIVKNGAMRHRLQLQKQSIISQINEHLDSEKVTDLIFDSSERR